MWEIDADWRRLEIDAPASTVPNPSTSLISEFRQSLLSARDEVIRARAVLDSLVKGTTRIIAAPHKTALRSSDSVSSANHKLLHALAMLVRSKKVDVLNQILCILESHSSALHARVAAAACVEDIVRRVLTPFFNCTCTDMLQWYDFKKQERNSNAQSTRSAAQSRESDVGGKNSVNKKEGHLTTTNDENRKS